MELKLGTRGSPLALWQAREVERRLKGVDPTVEIRIVKIRTLADRHPRTPIEALGNKSLFVKEIEEALLGGKIDLAVHSLKDLTVVLPQGLVIGAVLRRDDPRDVLVATRASDFLGLPHGAVIGTSSLRRQAQIKNFRPDLQVVPIRGNVETRLQKVTEGKMDAVVLAAAGLKRLGLEGKITEYLPISMILPAVGQGVIAVQCRVDDHRQNSVLRELNDRETEACIRAERAFLAATGGDCQAPIAAFAVCSGREISLTGVLAVPSGRELIRNEQAGSRDEPEVLGQGLAELMLGMGGKQILKKCMTEGVTRATDGDQR